MAAAESITIDRWRYQLLNVGSERMPDSGQPVKVFQADLAKAVSIEFRLGLVSIAGNDGTQLRIVLWEFLCCLVSINGHAFASAVAVTLSPSSNGS